MGQRRKRGTGNIDPAGYLTVRYNGKSVRYHRIVAAEKYGKSIEELEPIHHIDGDKLNNDPENLIEISQSDHCRHHFVGRKHSEESRKKMSETRKLLYGRGMATCHPDRPHNAKGLCANCYRAMRKREVRRLKKLADKPEIV